MQKKKKARPSGEQRRTAWLVARVTRAERRKAAAVAKAHGETLSDLIRRLVVKK